MPFSPNPEETVLYPSPFVPTEHQRLIISNKRLVQFSPEPTTTFPVAEFPLEKIEHVGRMSERSGASLGIVSVVVGFIFLIVFVVKVLPAVMYAGANKSGEQTAGPGNGDDDSGIEGRDSNDEDPFASEKDAEVRESIRDKANKKIRKIKEVSFGIPPLTEDVVVGLLSLLVGGGAVLLGRSLYNKQQHSVFCRVGEIVYRIDVDSPMQQTQILATIQAAQQALPKK
jgi:hypothetical protein